MSGERRVPWEAVFGNARPVEVEIGPGRGDTLFAAAAASPAHNFFAVERTPGAVNALLREATRRELANVRAVAADARCIIALCIPDASVAAYHVYFPDPWPKRRHHRRRLVTPDFAADLRRTLVPGGVVHLATDVAALFDAYAATLVHAGLVRDDALTPATRPTTHFERRYAHAGTYEALFVRPD